MIEILSYGKQDIKRDRIYKRKLYGDYGVKEYWVVDGMFNTVEVYRLVEGGQQLVKRFEFTKQSKPTYSRIFVKTCRHFYILISYERSYRKYSQSIRVG